MNRQVAHMQTMAFTVVGEVLPRPVKGSVNSLQNFIKICSVVFPYMPGQTADKARYNRLSKIWLQAVTSPRQMMSCVI